ncbi:MAG TPA: LuxR C-terminal-related transcriptional regulator [candidate division Zixibacteria bacterium]|nr:LuxR C-terminal-related transcriptional regulator [candidate division Zixibacteria bacterium]
MPKATKPIDIAYNVCVPETLLKTKLFIPQPRPNLAPRPRLIERLNEGRDRKLTLISAPAGFGKTTLVSEWVAGCERPAAWLSLDEGDIDPTRFLSYLVAALQTVAAGIGEGLLAVLQSAQPPPIESILTALLNEITTIPDNFVLVLDDFHAIDARPVNSSTDINASTRVDGAIAFLLEHMPPQMHLIIATREDPQLPLARMRVQGQLTELRVTDLHFTSKETAEFLNQVMRLNLSDEDVTALKTRTEGWIAGLQLAAISMRGQKDVTSFIKSFTGSHHFVMDYLVEEVLQQQSESVQTFLLRTSILDRLSGTLCDALTGQSHGQVTLETLERANLFLVPLDNERRWYRYHHLFAELLRQRLDQHSASSMESEGVSVDELHSRASIWYEDNGLEIQAFRHAAAANDIERAARLIEGEGVPVQYRGAAAPVRNWLASLPTTVLDAWPSLWVTYASSLNLSGQPANAERKLQAAEAALKGAEPGDKTRDLIGHIAAIRAMMAVTVNQVETIFAQSQRALAHLDPNNVTVRTIVTWTLGYAYQLQGDREAASRAYSEVISISQGSGDIISTLAAATGLGNIRESWNQLFLAAESYQRGLQLFGDQPQPVACETSLGLARIHYEWNDLDAAQRLGQQSLQLARQLTIIDTYAISGAFLARIKITQGDIVGAAAMLLTAEQFMRQRNFVDRMPKVAAVQVLCLLHQGNLAAAAHLAEEHELPISQTRVHLAQGDAGTALAVLGPLRRRVEAKGLEDERLKVMVLQAVALYANGEKEEAVQLLGDTLALAEPGGFIRTFVDEGPPMAYLLYETLSRGIASDYARQLLAAFPAVESEQTAQSKSQTPETDLIEPLSDREIEVLQLIAEGLTNQEIASRLFLSLNTVKVHTRNINGKLGVHNRMQAAAIGRALGILPSI